MMIFIVFISRLNDA